MIFDRQKACQNDDFLAPCEIAFRIVNTMFFAWRYICTNQALHMTLLAKVFLPPLATSHQVGSLVKNESELKLTFKFNTNQKVPQKT